MLKPPRATICILTFGEELAYFQRALTSILTLTPESEIELRLGFNQAPSSFYFALGRLCPDATRPRVETAPSGMQHCHVTRASGMEVRFWNSPVNLYKEPMCRTMYYDIPLMNDYVIWLDDDSFVETNWWQKLVPLMGQKVSYIGQMWWVDYLPGQTAMIREQPWYRGVPFDQRHGKEGVLFATGGFVAAHVDGLYHANFPDTNFRWKDDTLKQYGGDTLLGEIARQLGWSCVHHDDGIKINVDLNGKHPAPRRGGTGRQFGSDIDVVIK